jgi:hypothetical protein
VSGGDRVQRPFRVARVVFERARSAVAALKGVPHAPQSLDALVSEALDEKVSRLEERFNDGEPFPPVEGVLPTTPPAGEVARIAALGREARAAKRKGDR